MDVEAAALPPRSRISWLRYAGLFALAALSAGGFAWLLFPHAALPITWDELLYMGIAYDPRPEAWVLNRYFHISVLSAFMAVIPDPFEAVRWWWCVNAGVALVATFALLGSVDRSLRPAGAVLLAFLVFTQITFSWSRGVGYADYTVLLMVSLSAALVARPVFLQRELPRYVPVVLGLLLVLGIRSKDTAAVLLWLVPLCIFRPDGSLRMDRYVFGFLTRYAGGALLGVAFMMVCEWLLVGDALFGLRPSSWRGLLGHNLRPAPLEQYTWLTWMLRAENTGQALLYVLAACALVAFTRDRRQMILLSLPLMFFLMLTVVAIGAVAKVSARTTLPILPVMSGLTVVALLRLIPLIAASAAGRYAAGYTLAAGALGGLLYCWYGWSGAPAFLTDMTRFRGTVIPLLVFSAVVGLLAAFVVHRRLRLPAAVLVLLLLGVGMLNTGLRHARGLQSRTLVLHAEKRFAGLRELAGAVAPGPDGRILVDRRVYDGELAGRGRWALAAYVQMSARQRYAEDRVHFVADVTSMNEVPNPADVVMAPPEILAVLHAELETTPADNDSAAPESSGARWMLTTAKDGQIAALHAAP